MNSLTRRGLVFVLAEVGLLAGFDPFIDALPEQSFRAETATFMAYGLVAVLAAAAFLILLVRGRSGDWPLARQWAVGLFAVAALLIAGGWLTLVWAWFDEFRANDALPIIPVGMAATPAGLAVGAVAWLLSWVGPRRGQS